MLTDFLGYIKQQMFYQLSKFKLDTLIINHFINENNLYGMVTRNDFNSFPSYTYITLFYKR